MPGLNTWGLNAPAIGADGNPLGSAYSLETRLTSSNQPCKVDVYILINDVCGIPGNMDPVILLAQADATAIVNDLYGLQGVDMAIGVGRYRDYAFIQLPDHTAPYPMVRYGNGSANTSITVASGATASVPFAPGPTMLRQIWTGSPPTATEGSPITVLQYGSGWFNSVRRTAYAHVRGTAVGEHPEGTVTLRMIIVSGGPASPFVDGAILGDCVSVVPAGENSDISAVVYPTLGGDALPNEFQINGFAGGTIKVEITNNLTVPINLNFKSFIEGGNTAGGQAFCFQHQLLISKSRDDAIYQINKWEAGASGPASDIPEGWYYAIQRVAEDDNGRIGWREDSDFRILVHIGDTPAHDPVCAYISGETAVTQATLHQAVELAGLTYTALNYTGGLVPDGLDDPVDSSLGPNYNDYTFYCGTQNTPGGQATALKDLTDGLIIRDPDPFREALVSLVEETVEICRLRRRRIAQVTLIGAT